MGGGRRRTRGGGLGEEKKSRFPSLSFYQARSVSWVGYNMALLELYK